MGRLGRGFHHTPLASGTRDKDRSLLPPRQEPTIGTRQVDAKRTSALARAFACAGTFERAEFVLVGSRIVRRGSYARERQNNRQYSRYWFASFHKLFSLL
jgi:hypothetical protein